MRVMDLFIHTDLPFCRFCALVRQVTGNRQQITLTITPTLLERVDQLAAELGQSRAAVINLAIHRAVEHGLDINGLGKV